MKSRILIRRGNLLLYRERCLRERFLIPIYGASSWDPSNLDAASAYVGLLHAESEAALEYMVRNTLDNSVEVTKRYASHKVLTNALIYYKRHIYAKVPELRLIPSRKDLERDNARTIALWDDHAQAHYETLLKTNHGAGMRYVEKLLHPLGVVVDRERFNKLKDFGLKEIADVADIGSTDLRELVSLRGVAMHATLSVVATALSATNPIEIGKRGEAAAKFTMNLAKNIARSAW
ncbi:hypothetical protein OG323_14605 [Streptomyces cyaneofuscatus]|uniref:hypothetical protein n=1 Tax=Streptomyces cyaneofuscatus TaxID=66883 RepID=UPI0038632C52|nr:hypothetical protein OG323_14605 [Streptomyces cyaneofuscatus]